MSREARRRRAAKRQAARPRAQTTSPFPRARRSELPPGVTEALCRDCNFHFATTQRVGFVGTGGTDIRDAWIGCPRCGGQAGLVRPTVEISDGGQSTLIASSPELLDHLRDLVERLRAGQVSAEEAADAIEASFPSLRKLATWIRANHMGLAAWAAVVVAVLTYVQDNQGIAPEDLPAVIEQVVDQVEQHHEPAPAAPKGRPGGAAAKATPTGTASLRGTFGGRAELR